MGKITLDTMIILGSTGSIGTQALEIARAENLCVEVLSAGENIDLLNAQIAEFHPKIAVIKDSNKRHLVRGVSKVLCGELGIIEAINESNSNFVLNALVGFSGVNPSLEAIKCKKTLALANKESLVVAGFLIDLANLKQIIPVDSEHFALKELIDSNKSINSQIDLHIKKMLITASGGAFRDLPINEIPSQCAKNALKHPNWAMGRKITIDSATMINKLFEILEAKWLFSIDNINAVIERSSTIHALIQTNDNALIAHLSSNDMKLPIANALLGTKAKNCAFIKELDLFNLSIRFEQIDINRYPLWKLKDLLLKNPKLGIIINATNDILVERFLCEKICFGDIASGIFAVLERFGDESASISNINEIMDLNAKITDFLKDY